MAQRALPLLLLLAAVVVVVAAAPAQGEFIELGSRRWLQEMGAVAPAEGPAAADSGLGYISYGALSANTVPCSERGLSYYNCQPGGEVNPYTRGCSAIALCRG
ncbi:uncharacterized protein [Lolium perenne]|jgi:hypothetical protein|uniref:uncharacterized protein n=1 Tax=Lolium perenne TaxID=4522 RepID=UPI0021EA1037|nr:protein RALF-like 33 [Lolium perenne]